MTSYGKLSVLTLPKLAVASNTTLLKHVSHLTHKTLHFLGSPPAFLATAVQSLLVPSACLYHQQEGVPGLSAQLAFLLFYSSLPWWPHESSQL